MGEAKRNENQLMAAMEAIAAGTLLVVRPGDKVIVRVMANVPHEKFMELHAVCAQFFGDTQFLMVPAGVVEFMALRPEDAVTLEQSNGEPISA